MAGRQIRIRGKIDILAYQKRNISELIPGTSVRAKIAPHMLEPPALVRGVENMTKPVGTAEAVMPRGYLIPAELADVADKLRTHNITRRGVDEAGQGGRRRVRNR